jgi:hypothetical protein
LTFARQIVNAGLSISTLANTDITLNPGAGGYIVPHSDIIPYTTNIWSLGTPAKRFKEIWLGAGTIYVQDETLGNDQALGAKDGNFYIKGGAGLEVGEFTLLDNQIKIANNARDMIVGTIGATANVVFNRAIQVNTANGFNSFSITRSGRVQVNVPNIPAGDSGGLNIVGSANGVYQPVTSAGGMLHITGNDGAATRVSLDNYSANSAASFNALVARQARGTSDNPLATEANDTLFRIVASGWREDTGFGGVTAGQSPSSIDIVSLEHTTLATRGSAQRFYNAPLGSNTRNFSSQIDSTGLSFVQPTGNIFNANIGITFNDGTRQITAANNAGYAVNTTVNTIWSTTNTAYSTANSAWTTANTQSDWNVSDTANVAYIRNKPTLVTTLDGLSDVTALSPLNDQVLTFNTATGQWINQAIGISANNLTTGYFGSFYYNGANVAMSNTSLAYTVPITGSYGGTNGVTTGGNNDILIAHAGNYHVEYSIQLENSGNQSDDVDVWVRVNGVNLANTGSKFTVHKKENSNEPGSLIAVTPFLLTLNAADRVQFEIASTSGITKIASYPAQINPVMPAIPAVIVNVQQTSSIVIPNDIAGTANNANYLGGYSANSYIKLSTLKSVVANSTSFADFQTRIANL